MMEADWKPLTPLRAIYVMLAGFAFVGVIGLGIHWLDSNVNPHRGKTPPAERCP